MATSADPLTAATLRSLLSSYDVLLSIDLPPPTAVDEALSKLQELVMAVALEKEKVEEGKLFLKLQKKAEWNGQ